MIIYVRNKHFWNKLKLDDLHLFCEPNSVKYEYRQNYLRWWDQTFTVPYFEYRWQIYEIARQNWEATGATIFQSDVTTFQQNLRDISPDEWMVSTDDDDWFAPSLNQFLSPHEAEFIHWKSIVYFTTSSVARFRYWDRPTELCTNNFAIRVGAAQKLDLPTLVKCNEHPALFGVAKRNNWRTIQLSEPLSCYNYHPGGAHVVLNKIGSDTTFAKTSPEPGPKMEWVKPYSEAFLNITRNVKPRYHYL